MNTEELITSIKSEVDLPKKTIRQVLDGTVDAIQAALTEGEKVRFGRLGTFRVTEKAKCTGRNPATGEAIKIPARKLARFKASKETKELLNG